MHLFKKCLSPRHSFSSPLSSLLPSHTCTALHKKRILLDTISAKEASSLLLSDPSKRPKTLSPPQAATSLHQPPPPPRPFDDDEFEADIDDLLALEANPIHEPSGSALHDASLQPDNDGDTGEDHMDTAAASGGKKKNNKEEEEEEEEEEHLLIPKSQYIPPSRMVSDIQGDSFEITSSSGERVYCAFKTDESSPGGGNGGGGGKQLDLMNAMRKTRGRSGLLMQDFHTLEAAVDKQNFEAALAESKAAAAEQQQQQQQQQLQSTGDEQQAHNNEVSPGSSSALWAAKYAPSSFLDLLSDEQINRDVVRWLKSWDPCVFGTPDTTTGMGRRASGSGGIGGIGRNNKFTPSRSQRGGGGYGNNSSFGTNGGYKNNNNNNNTSSNGSGGDKDRDVLGRPEHLVILLSGPPGFGKTTLAHIAARHCGYRPVEINASDDRNAQNLTSKVIDAVQMQSVMGEKRPNCVILDEIDGAAGGAEGRSAIQALIKIVTAAAGSGGSGGGKQQGVRKQGKEDDSDDEDEDEQGRASATKGKKNKRPLLSAGLGTTQLNVTSPTNGGKKKKQRPLLRPIIAICNDLYAPALRPLRDIAKVFSFKRPSAERLAQRLQIVCSTEGLACEKSTLRMLADKSDCDMRTCLNTLQFLSRRGQRAIRAYDIEAIKIGQKDVTKGAFAMWNELMQRKKQQGTMSSIKKQAESESERVDRLYSSLQDFGEYDLVLYGLQENMQNMRYFDMALTRTCKLVDHLADADIFLQSAFTYSDFRLFNYAPAPIVSLSLEAASHERPAIQWPRVWSDARRRGQASASMVTGWMAKVYPSVFAATGPNALVQEILPSLLRLTAPNLRPVSFQLYSAEEKAAVSKSIEVLLSYGVRFGLEAEDEEAQREAAEFGSGGGAQHAQQQLIRGLPSSHQQNKSTANIVPLSFRPGIHKLASFAGWMGEGRRSLPLAVRQVINHEADMEAIRRSTDSMTHGMMGVDGDGSGHTAITAPPPVVTAAVTGPLQLTVAQRLKEAQAKARARKGITSTTAATNTMMVPRKKNWLEQMKDTKQDRQEGIDSGTDGGTDGDGTTKKAAANGKTGPVLYKFNEGYTNSVKRPVLTKELL